MSNIQEPKNLKLMAQILDGKVVNVSVWDGVSLWEPEGPVVEIPDGVNAGVGWDCIDGKFVDNRPQDEEL